MAKIATLSDLFPSLDTTVKWNATTGVSVAGLQLRLASAVGTTRALTSQALYDLAGSSIQVQLVQTLAIGDQTTSTGLYLESSVDTTDRIEILWDGVGGTPGRITFRHTINGTASDTSVAFNSTNHRVLLISESGGTLTWATSPSGLAGTFTTQRTLAVGAIDITSVRVGIKAVSGTEATPGTAIYDNLNPFVVPATPGGWFGFMSSRSAIAPPPPVVTGKKMILLTYFMPNAQFLNTHRAYIDTLPFDGYAFSMFVYSPQIMSNTVVSQSAIGTELSLLGTGTWTRGIDKWVVVNANSVGAANTFTNDTNWNIAIANFTKLATEVAARTSSHHLAGILFDTETYFGQVWEGPDTDQTLAYNRGVQIMTAIIAGWPAAQVMVTHGTWASDPRTVTVYNAAGAFYDDLSNLYNTVGSFTAGMVAATAGTAAQFIDGSEMYTARNASEYQAIYDWNKTGVASGVGSLVPSGDQAAYPSLCDISFGVMDMDWGDVTMANENEWKATLQFAINRADNFIWAYAEQYDWLGVEAGVTIPPAWVTKTGEVIR